MHYDFFLPELAVQGDDILCSERDGRAVSVLSPDDSSRDDVHRLVDVRVAGGESSRLLSAVDHDPALRFFTTGPIGNQTGEPRRGIFLQSDVDLRASHINSDTLTRSQSSSKCLHQ